MKKNRLKILSTKILSKEVLNKASLNGIEIDELSFISTAPIKSEGLKKILKEFLQQNIIAVFTSKNAVLAFNQIANAEVPWKIFCIGFSTKEFVSKIFGEEKISGTADTADELSNIILADKEIKKVIFFCGKQRREELPEKLKCAGILLEEIVVYQTAEIPQKISRKNYDGILFFSPSAAKSFFSVNHLNKKIICFAIGETTATEIKKFTNNRIIISKSPSQEIMLETINFYLQDINVTNE